MRNAFADEITKLATLDSKIILLSGDIGNRLFDNLKKQSNGKQFINCGIAEANMISVAAGLALSGARPVVYTITPFTTIRCLEQIKIGLAYHEAPVVIIGTGSGLSYASLGPTHHSLEDFAIFQSIPNMRIFAPWDQESTRKVLREGLKQNAPTYIRIGKKGEPALCPIEKIPEIGKLLHLQQGEVTCILAVGTISSEAFKASKLLRQENILVGLSLCHTVKPLPTKDIEELCLRYENLFVIEEHSQVGGFGSSVIAYINSKNFPAKVFTIGTGDAFLSKVGSQDFARKEYGIDSDSIVRKIKKCLAL